MTELSRQDEGEVVSHPTYGRGQIKEVAQGSIFVSFYDWPGMYVFSIEDLRNGFKASPYQSTTPQKQVKVELPDRA